MLATMIISIIIINGFTLRHFTVKGNIEVGVVGRKVTHL